MKGGPSLPVGTAGSAQGQAPHAANESTRDPRRPHSRRPHSPPTADGALGRVSNRRRRGVTSHPRTQSPYRTADHFGRKRIRDRIRPCRAVGDPSSSDPLHDDPVYEQQDEERDQDLHRSPREMIHRPPRPPLGVAHRLTRKPACVFLNSASSVLETVMSTKVMITPSIMFSSVR